MVALDAEPVKPDKVYRRLAKHYPPHVLEWVDSLKWQRKRVPLARIHMQARPAAPRNEAKVAAIRRSIRAGETMKPVVLVNTGRGKHKIADGYHRLEAAKLEGHQGHDALIGRTRARSGPWSRAMHAEKLNT